MKPSIPRLLNSLRSPSLLSPVKALPRNTKTFSHSHTRNIDVSVYDTHTEYHIPLYSDGWNVGKPFWTVVLHIDASLSCSAYASGTGRTTRLSFPKVSPQEE